MGDSNEHSSSPDSRIVGVVAALRRAIDREAGLALLTEAVADIPGVTSVHVTVREGTLPESSVHGDGEAAMVEHDLGAGGTDPLVASVLVVRQAGDIPSTWPATSHTWRPGVNDRALHRALLNGRAWEGMIGPDGTDRSVSQKGRRFAAALPVLGERGAVAQILLTSSERLDERLIGLAHVLAAAAGPVLSSTPRRALATATEEAVGRVARTLASAGAAKTAMSLVAARLVGVERLRREQGPEVVAQAQASLREILTRKHPAWRDRSVLRGEDGELFVTVTDVSREDVLIRVGELREEARHLIEGVEVRWGSATLVDHAAVAEDLRVSAEALVTVTRAARDAMSPGPGRNEAGAAAGGVLAPDPEQLVRLVDEVLTELDAMIDVPVGERVAAVVARTAECVDAAAWQVSRIQGEVVRSHRLEIVRPPGGPSGREPLFDKIDYLFAGRPAIARAAEGSAFSVTLASGDVTERMSLAVNGFTGEVAAGGYDPDAHRWLLELYADDQTRDLTVLSPTLLALVQAALGFPRAISASGGGN